MKRLEILLVGIVVGALLGEGQVLRLTREQVVKYTPENPFERFPDGRPKVPEGLLERVKKLSVEEAWGVLRDKGYHNQYGG